MANIPSKPQVSTVAWVNGQTRLNHNNLTAGVNTNLLNIKTAVDGVVDFLADDTAQIAKVGSYNTMDAALTAIKNAIVADDNMFANGKQYIADIADDVVITVVGCSYGNPDWLLIGYVSDFTESGDSYFFVAKLNANNIWDVKKYGMSDINNKVDGLFEDDVFDSIGEMLLASENVEGVLVGSVYNAGNATENGFYVVWHERNSQTRNYSYKFIGNACSGTGGRIATAPTPTYHITPHTVPLIEVTYSQLKALRDGGQLIPGQQYRITNYDTYTAQSDTSSAHHLFDIIVTADTEFQLNENARACGHQGDTYFATAFEYQSNVRFEYVLYDDTKEEKYDSDGIARYDDTIMEGRYENGTPVLYKTDVEEYGDEIDYGDCFTYEGDIEFNGVQYNKWYKTEGPEHTDTGLAFLTRVIVVNNQFVENVTVTKTPSDYSCSLWKLKYCLDNDVDRFGWADSESGKGVIYRMVDEFGNDAPYDFKNIQFKRYKVSVDTSALSDFDGLYYGCKDLSGSLASPRGYTIDDDTDFTWCYTFNGVDSESNSIDMSIQGNLIFNDEGYISGCYKNVLGPCDDYSIYPGTSSSKMRFWLGNNVFQLYNHNDDGYFYGCYSNTVGGSFYFNTIGNDFYYNTIGGDFYYNAIGDNFRSNTIGNQFCYNTIGNDFGDDAIGNLFRDNTIGKHFNFNTIGAHFYFNAIGNSFRDNTIGKHFNFNTIGNEFYGNTIGNDFNNNTIGASASVDIYVRYCEFDGGVQYVSLTSDDTSATSSNYLQNVHVHSGVKGTSSARKTITVPDRNLPYSIDYYFDSNGNLVTLDDRIDNKIVAAINANY